MADQASEGLLSPFLRSRRLAAAAPYLRGRILDVGCGSGALAGLVAAGRYVGVEMDQISLLRARAIFPQHDFLPALPCTPGSFDTVVSLAVIEHVHSPVAFLQSMALHLADDAGARILVTTPHPNADRVHDAGAAIGLFSRHASEEHGDLLDRNALEAAGNAAGLRLVRYARFLLGANQLALYARGAA